MLRNYFITAYRNLERNRAYTFLNIIGLALGIGCALVIYKVISYELSFDTHLEQYDQIYRVVRVTERADGRSFDSGANHPLAQAMKAEFPEVKAAASVEYQTNLQVGIRTESGDYRRFREESGIAFAQTSIFEILDFEWLAGNPEAVLNQPNEVIISVEWMMKFYGLDRSQANLALGKVMNLENKKDLVVVGVYENFPETTDYPFKMVINYETQEGLNGYYLEGKSWNTVSSSTNCLIVLEDQANPEQIERKLPDLLEKYMRDGVSRHLTLQLQPMSDIHFNASLYNYPERSVNNQVLVALTIIGLVLVVTACINFINLATAQAIKRAKEIGIRKVMGGHKTQLMVQFMSETIIITLLAVLVSLGIAELLMINLVDVLSYRLHLSLVSEPMTLLFLALTAILVGLLSGLYPAFLLSRINTIQALKTKLSSTSSGGLSLRRALVIFQFCISQMLIICTIIVASQMEYFGNKELGFERDGIIVTYLPDNNKETLARLKNQLLAHPEIKRVSFNLSAPTGESDSYGNFNYLPANIEEDPHANFKQVDEDYIDLFGLELIAGRKLRAVDSNNVIINRQIVELMGLENPEDALGETLKGGGFGQYSNMNIVGVLENFHTRSLDMNIDFVIMMTGINKLFFEASVQYNGSETDPVSARRIVEKEWAAVFPDNVFDYDYYDDQLMQAYEAEKGLSQLLTIFAVIAIFIGCLGLYGLITFMANQKTKEIGIRKVLGASVVNILTIFTRELVVLLLVAFVIAAPVGFMGMNIWLDNFIYHIEIGPGIFVISVLISLFIALVTMGYRSVKAAVANPSDSLMDE